MRVQPTSVELFHASQQGRRASFDLQHVDRFTSIQLPGSHARLDGPTRDYLTLAEDFVAPAGSNLPAWLVGTKTGSSTNNVVDYASNEAGGLYKLLHSNDSEAQTMRLTSGDNLWINMSKKPLVDIGFKVTLSGSTLSADQRLVVGVGSAYNATLDSVTTNCWLRVEGASNSIKIESDDGTTDTDDTASGYSITSGTAVHVQFDFSDLSKVRVLINGALVATSLNMSALAANTKVQPFIAIQRDAGTETDRLDIDYIKVSVLR